MGVRYSYIREQFVDADDLWAELKSFVATGDFTLGKPLNEFENNFAKLIGTKYAIGVNSGTDAIKLSLKALGVKPGSEVITNANTFVATVGAINELGATPVFVDCNENFCMDVEQVEKVISTKTAAILPVHFSGYMTQMKKLMEIGNKYRLPVIEDACQSILGSIENINAGNWGIAGAFSLHPLKNINVWSDGGVITTNDFQLAKKLKLLRNHGLKDRDTVEILGFNSRLDTFQAVVGNWLLPKALNISESRIKNAKYLDDGLSKLTGIKIPDRTGDRRIVYHLYMVFAEKRDELLSYCLKHDIQAKVHYPVPIYRQPALKFLGLEKGDYPVTDYCAENTISFPCDQHLSKQQLDEIIKVVSSFYQNN
jgi:dTDP-4-amino-4,6-dideoxygalactose transaminase